MANRMTQVQEIILERMTGMDAKLKEYGAEKYGMVKGTEKEKREMFRNLTPQKLGQLIQEHGADQVNEWLGKYMKEEY